MLQALSQEVIVYRYLRPDRTPSLRPATIAAIEECGGTPIANSGQRVSRLRLNGSEHFIAPTLPR